MFLFCLRSTKKGNAEANARVLAVATQHFLSMDLFKGQRHNENAGFLLNIFSTKLIEDGVSSLKKNIVSLLPNRKDFLKAREL